MIRSGCVVLDPLRDLDILITQIPAYLIMRTHTDPTDHWFIRINFYRNGLCISGIAAVILA